MEKVASLWSYEPVYFVCFWQKCHYWENFGTFYVQLYFREVIREGVTEVGSKGGEYVEIYPIYRRISS